MFPQGLLSDQLVAEALAPSTSNPGRSGAP